MLMVRSATGLSWERWLQELPAAMSPSRVRTYSRRWDQEREVTSVVVIQFLCEALEGFHRVHLRCASVSLDPRVGKAISAEYYWKDGT